MVNLLVILNSQLLNWTELVKVIFQDKNLELSCNVDDLNEDWTWLQLTLLSIDEGSNCNTIADLQACALAGGKFYIEP